MQSALAYKQFCFRIQLNHALTSKLDEIRHELEINPIALFGGNYLCPNKHAIQLVPLGKGGSFVLVYASGEI